MLLVLSYKTLTCWKCSALCRVEIFHIKMQVQKICYSHVSFVLYKYIVNNNNSNADICVLWYLQKRKLSLPLCNTPSAYTREQKVLSVSDTLISRLRQSREFYF